MAEAEEIITLYDPEEATPDAVEETDENVITLFDPEQEQAVEEPPVGEQSPQGLFFGNQSTEAPVGEQPPNASSAIDNLPDTLSVNPFAILDIFGADTSEYTIDTGIPLNKNWASLLVPMGSSMSDIRRGVKQIAEIDIEEEAQNQKFLNDLYASDYGGVATVGSILGYLVEPAGLILPSGKLKSLGGAIARGAAYGGIYGGLGYVDEESGRTRTSQTLQGVGVGATLGGFGYGIYNKLRMRGEQKHRNALTRLEVEVAQMIDDGMSPTDASKLLKENYPQLIHDAQVASQALGVKPHVPLTAEQAKATLDYNSGLYKQSKFSKNFEKVAGILHTTIEQHAPKVANRMREMEYRIHKRPLEYHVRARPFLSLLDDISKKDDSAFAEINTALINGDFDVALRKVKAFASGRVGKYEGFTPEQAFEEAQKVFQNLGDELKSYGIIDDTISNYWHRKIVDMDGFLDALGVKKKASKDHLMKLIQEKNDKLTDPKMGRGFEMTPAELSNYVQQVWFKNKNLRGIEYANLRKFDKVPLEFSKFYANPAQSMDSYIHNAIWDIEQARFFGGKPRIKAGKGKVKSVLKIDEDNVLNLDHTINTFFKNFDELKALQQSDPARARIVKDALQARFGVGQQHANQAIRWGKNLAYSSLLANPYSAITQIGDLGSSIYRYGFFNTMKGAVKHLTGGKHSLNVNEFGLIDRAFQEFADVENSSRFLEKALKYSGFNFVDRIGKGSIINAAMSKYSKGVMNTNSKAFKELSKKYRHTWGKEFHKLVDELKQYNKTGEISENMKLLAWNELSDIQPISLSEVPEMYLRMPNGKVLYMLKTFMLKQFDLLRNTAFSKIKEGDIAGGVGDLTKYALVMTATNSGAQLSKDFIFGTKDPDAFDKDYPEWGLFALANLTNTFGINKYFYNQALNDPFDAVVNNYLLPPYKVLTEIFYKSWANDSKYLIKNIPGIGRPMYKSMQAEDGTEGVFTEWVRENKYKPAHNILEKGREAVGLEKPEKTGMFNKGVPGFAEGGAVDIALPFVAEKEGFKAEAYPDPYYGKTGKADNQMAIGYGRTTGDMSPTTREAEQQYLKEQLTATYDKLSNEIGEGTWKKLNPQQQASVMSLAYNIDKDVVGQFKNSKALSALKQGDWGKFMYEAFDPNVGFVKRGDKALPGLVSRRQEERDMFASGFNELAPSNPNAPAPEKQFSPANMLGVGAAYAEEPPKPAFTPKINLDMETGADYLARINTPKENFKVWGQDSALNTIPPMEKSVDKTAFFDRQFWADIKERSGAFVELGAVAFESAVRYPLSGLAGIEAAVTEGSLDAGAEAVKSVQEGVEVTNPVLQGWAQDIAPAAMQVAEGFNDAAVWWEDTTGIPRELSKGTLQAMVDVPLGMVVGSGVGGATKILANNMLKIADDAPVGGTMKSQRGVFRFPGQNKANEAEALLKQGATEEDVYNMTNLWKAKDGKWREEVFIWDDLQPIFDVIPDKPKKFKELMSPEKLDSLHSKGLGYLEDVTISKTKGKGSSFNPNTREITIGKDFERRGHAVFHELHHWIAQKEGFARGANPDSMRALLGDELYENFVYKMDGMTDKINDLAVRLENEGFTIPNKYKEQAQQWYTHFTEGEYGLAVERQGQFLVDFYSEIVKNSKNPATVKLHNKLLHAWEDVNKDYGNAYTKYTTTLGEVEAELVGHREFWNKIANDPTHSPGARAHAQSLLDRWPNDERNLKGVDSRPISMKEVWVNERLSYAHKAEIQDAADRMVLWHSSPHKFDGKLDPDKFLSGEGAAMKGPGMYLSESEKISGPDGHYFTYFSDLADVKINGADAADYVSDITYHYLRKGEGDLNKAIASAEKRMREADVDLRRYKGQPEEMDADLSLQEATYAYKELLDLRTDKAVVEKGGAHAYEYELPDAEYKNLLDETADVSGDPRAQKLWADMYPEMPEIPKGTTGEELIEQIAYDMGDADFTPGWEVKEIINDTLSNAGYVGLRYLDGFSRKKGGGSYNVVMFHDHLDKLKPKKRISGKTGSEKEVKELGAIDPDLMKDMGATAAGGAYLKYQYDKEQDKAAQRESGSFAEGGAVEERKPDVTNDPVDNVQDPVVKGKLEAIMKRLDEEQNNVPGMAEGGEVKPPAMEKMEPGLYQDEIGDFYKVTKSGEVVPYFEEEKPQPNIPKELLKAAEEGEIQIMFDTETQEFIPVGAE